MKINFKEAFTFMFKDTNFWQKYAVGTLINAIPTCGMVHAFTQMIRFNSNQNPNVQDVISICGWLGLSLVCAFILTFSIGYCIEYANKKILTGSNELPQWSGNFKKFFINGLKLYAGVILISILATIVCSAFYVLYVIIGVVITAISGLIFQKEGVAIAILILLILLLIIYLMLYAALYIFMIIAKASFLIDKNILSVVNFKRINSLRKNNIINAILILLLLLLNSIPSLLLYVIPSVYCIGLVILNFYFLMVYYNLLSQYALIGIQKNQERLETQKVEPATEN